MILIDKELVDFVSRSLGSIYDSRFSLSVEIAELTASANCIGDFKGRQDLHADRSHTHTSLEILTSSAEVLA